MTRYSKGLDDPKLEWLDYGLLGLTREILVAYRSGPAEFVDLGEITARLAATGSLAAAKVDAKFWEVGTPESYEEVDQHLEQLRLKGLDPLQNR